MPRETGGPDDLERIEHMLLAAQSAISFIQNRERASIDSDEMLRRALVNAVQEIGEAAARVTDSGRARVPGLPWGQMVAMRNILVHVYWGVDPDQLWKVVAIDLPVLVTQIEIALPEWRRTEDLT